mgnify:CR=1 FL=1
MICRCRTVFRGIEKIGGEENGYIKNTINTQKDKEGKYKSLIDCGIVLWFLGRKFAKQK